MLNRVCKYIAVLSASVVMTAKNCGYWDVYSISRACFTVDIVLYFGVTQNLREKVDD